MTTTLTPALAAALTAGTRPSGSRGLTISRLMPLATMSSMSPICLVMLACPSAEVTAQPAFLAWSCAACIWAAK